MRTHDDHQGLYDRLSYWSPAEARTTEVDFVLTRGEKVIAIEAKSSARLSKRDFLGLSTLSADVATERRILVYTGQELRLREGIEIWPLQHFLKILKEGSL